MSDYLSRIVERAGAPATAIRPALPSLFEPVKPQGGFTGVVAAQEMDTVFEPRLENRNEEAPLNGTLAGRQPSPDRGGTFRASMPKNRESATEPASSNGVRMPVTGLPVRERSSDSPAALQFIGEGKHHESVFRPQASPASQSMQPQSVSGEAKPAFDPFASTDSIPVQRQPAQVLTAAVAMTGTHAPIANRTRTESGFVSNADSSQEPAIQVTIGRVEVRAILPAAPATQTRTRPAPQLSLEDYLRSRNGGAG